MRVGGELGLVVIDYLQLVTAGGKHGNREQEVAEVSRGIKALAKDLDVPVLALSQLNRHVERAEKKEPSLADLRESGAIEQDADVVAFLHRDAAFDMDADPTQAKVSVVKNRHGVGGYFDLIFDPKRMRFSDVERRYDEP